MRNKSLSLILCICTYFFIYSLYIDLHSDESIYITGIPFSSRSDTGPLYSLVYLPTYALRHANPLYIRLSSIFLYGISSAIIVRVNTLLGYTQLKSNIIILIFSLSLPTIFVSTRIRPESLSLLLIVLLCLTLTVIAKNSPTTSTSELLLSQISVAFVLAGHPLSLIIYLSFLPTVLFFAIKSGFISKPSKGNRYLSLLTLACPLPLSLLVKYLYSLTIPGFHLLPHSAGNNQSIISSLFNLVNLLFLTSASFLQTTSASYSHLLSFLPSPYSSHYLYFAFFLVLTAFMSIVFLLFRRFTPAFLCFPVLLQLVFFLISGYYNPTYTYVLATYPLLLLLNSAWSLSFISKR